MTLPSQNTPGPDHAAPTPPLVQRIRKAIVGAVGLAALLVSSGVLDDNTEAIVNGLIAVATLFGIYQVPNAEKKTPA